MNFFDLLLNDYFLVNKVPFLTDFFHFFTRVFDVGFYFFVLVLVAMIFIYYYKNLRVALFFLCTLLITGLIVLVLKYLFGISRPDGGVISVLGNSFPSYHATIATVFFSSLYYLFKDKMKENSKSYVLVICGLLILIVSLSRVYLGVHWFSDIVGGVALGSVIAWKFKRCFLLYK